jgi:outer membrane protein OmpA-like peptidoglycan-associated protein
MVCVKDIATVLNENPSINVNIIGHTDSDGNAAENLNLSKRRSEAGKGRINKRFWD